MGVPVWLSALMLELDMIEFTSRGQTDISQYQKLATLRTQLEIPGRNLVINPDVYMKTGPTPSHSLRRTEVPIRPRTPVGVGAGLGALGILQMIFHEYVEYKVGDPCAPLAPDMPPRCT